jgi:hypothetical protein
MVEKPQANAQQENSKRPRALDSQLGNSPRVLTPVENPKEAANSPNTQTNRGSTPFVLPTASEVKADADASIPSASLREPFNVSRAALDSLLAKTHDIHEQVWRVVQSLTADWHHQLRQECEARIAEFDREVSTRGANQTTALLDQIDLEAESRLAARVDHAIERVREAERRGLESLGEKVEASRTSFSEIAQSTTQEIQRQKAACLEGLQADAGKHLNDIKARHENDLKEIAQKTQTALNDVFVKQGADSMGAFQERLERLTDEIYARVEGRLSALADAALARLSNEIQAIVNRETSAALVETLRKRLDQIAHSLKD